MQIQGKSDPVFPLIRLRSSDGYVFYYDLLPDKPLVVAASDLASELAVTDMAAPPSAAVADMLASEAPVDRDRDAPVTPLAEPLSGPAALDGLIQKAGGLDALAASVGTADLALPVSQSPAAEEPAPARGAASGAQAPASAPASITAAVTPISGNQVLAAMNLADRDPRAESGCRRRRARSRTGRAGDAQGDRAAARGTDPVATGTKIDAIETNVHRSQGSLDGLKSYIEQLEGSFVDIYKFIDELDGSLSEIGRAFEELTDQLGDDQAVLDPLGYADCTELTAAQPIEFGLDDVDLSLEAVGWLFQTRRQLAAARSPERQEWLVIEGHAASTGQPAIDRAVSIQRAEAVRGFLSSELG